MPIKIHAAYETMEKKVRILLDNNKARVFNCSFSQYEAGSDKYFNGAHIQNAFSFLTPGEREFLMTGITPEEWDTMWPDDGEE